ncbi:MAG: MMPL family transporter [Planctomycetaceae bacterium]|nr:MMPL family transporter [Planctomycetaceae bacterium]
MFESLGKFVERRWQVILVCWAVALLAALGVLNGWYARIGLPVPTWREVAQDGEFAFLPPEVQSLAGEGLLAEAFPDDLLKSSVVIVVRRYQQKILPVDEQFIENVLKPRLEKIRDELLGDPSLDVRTFKNAAAGPLLVSQDREASLVILPLKSEFLEWRNKPIIDRIETLLYTELPAEIDPETQKGVIPTALTLAMSGSATVGRDMLVANDESGKKTELWTTILVIGLLLAIYRSPFLALIPLFTVFVAVKITLALVILLTQNPLWDYRVFFGMEVYITVVVYGTGVDYCLFLIARYKEELDKGLPLRQALSATLTSVGAAITASAFTVICGIGMMVFAQFGKFREAGIGITLGLWVGLAAALTLTPSLLRWAGSVAFWPFGRWERIHAPAGRISGTTLINRLVERNFFYRRWENVGRSLLKRPATILVACIVAMLPFAAWGLWNYEYLSYGLLSELPPSKVSVIGAKAVQEHFPAGFAGPLTILIKNDSVDFNDPDGGGMLEGLIDRLKSERERLGIADIRYLKLPLGLHVKDSRPKFFVNGGRKVKAADFYVSTVEGLAGHVTRVDVVFEKDPFEQESIRQLDAVEKLLKSALEDDPDLAPLKNSEIQFVGPTASIRDLKTVTDEDQIKIDILVLMSVFVVLVLLLKKPAISAYLIVSVFFSYFVTLGVTFVAFQWITPEGFAGLDWKVPMFLFTILMAIGEDYNIFLMTRIEEEQRRHGPIEGIRIAMLKTGTIISSCGIIMAGTFSSLLFGSLVGLKQLGFALAFGVLLDTFVVRPLLVPAYLILLNQGRFGKWGKLLGADPRGDVPPLSPPKLKPPQKFGDRAAS